MSFQGMAKDRSIISLSGASQQACTLNANRQFLLIQNTGANPVAINFSGPATGGTQTTTGVGNVAALGGTGCITLAPNERWPQAGNTYVPQNPVNIIGTAAQPCTVLEG